MPTRNPDDLVVGQEFIWRCQAGKNMWGWPEELDGRRGVVVSIDYSAGGWFVIEMQGGLLDAVELCHLQDWSLVWWAEDGIVKGSPFEWLPLPGDEERAFKTKRDAIFKHLFGLDGDSVW